MGGFLTAVAVAKMDIKEVLAILQDCLGSGEMEAELADGDALAEGLTLDSDKVFVLSGKKTPILILFPPTAFDYEDVAEHLSANYSSPAFALHVHDGDLWGYTFFVEGKTMDSFSTDPSYFGDSNEATAKKLAGNPKKVANHWPGVTVDSIENYFGGHRENELDGKAYPDDEHENWDGFQLLDFMRKLGIPSPESPEGMTVHVLKTTDASDIPGVPPVADFERIAAEKQKQLQELGEDTKKYGLTDFDLATTAPFLHLLAEKGCLDGVQKLLDCNPGWANLIDLQNQTPIYSAVAEGHIEVMRALLQAGAESHPFSRDNPIDYATLLFQQEAVRLLLDNGAEGDINAHIVAGNIETVRKLLASDKKALKKKKKECFEPFHHAAGVGNVEILKMLLSYGVSLAGSSRSPAPLHVAVEERHPDAVEFLLDAGAEADAEAVAIAAWKGKKVIFDLVWSKWRESNPESDFPEEYSLFHNAARGGNRDIIDMLFEFAPDINQFDEHGRTPLHWAIDGESTDTVRFLIERGADVNARGSSETPTALHDATCQGQIECVRLLVENGADINAKLSPMNTTPLRMAQQMRMHLADVGKETADYLREHGGRS